MMKRFLAMLLCLLICLSLFPAAALADGEAADSFAEETVGVSQPEDAAEAPTEETEDAVEVSVSDNDPGTPEEETPPVLPSESEEAQEPSEPAVGDAGTVPGAEMPDTEDHALGVPQEEFEDPFVPAEGKSGRISRSISCGARAIRPSISPSALPPARSSASPGRNCPA